MRDEETAQPIPGARVVLSWFNVTDMRREHFVAGTHNLVTVTNDAGEYVICGIPTDQALTIRAMVGIIKSRVVPLAARSTLIRMAHLSLAQWSAVA